jgi:CubicO group peptidase (beta-lactamase class C family)
MQKDNNMAKKLDKKWARLSEFISQTMKAKGIPGIAVGLWYKNQTWAAGYGVTSLEHPLPVTDKTLFQIGSITKTFTALAIMQLVEQGKVDLDAPVRTYLPDFQAQDEAVAAAVTVRHLLTHTAGWEGDLFHETGQGKDALAKYAALLADQEQVLPMDTAVSYNNASFSIAGYLIEQVTGKPYETIIQEQILDPLDMEETFFDARDVITHRFAVGHNGTPDDMNVARPWYLTRSAYPAGALCCHVQDLLKYGRYNLSNDPQLISTDSLAQLHKPQAQIFGKVAIALSWFVDDETGTRQLHHGGGTNGQISLLLLIPEHNLALVTLTNANNGGALNQEIVRWVLAEYLKIDLPEPEPIEYDTADLQPYAGKYDRPFAKIELGVLGGKLIGQMAYKKGFPDENSPPPPAPPPMTFMPLGEDHLIITDGPMAKSEAHFIRREDGSIGWLRLGLRAFTRLD